MKNILKILLFILFIAIIFLISKAMFEAIYYSDMPTWLKYILLK